MVIKISNKDIHKYKHMRKRMCFKGRKAVRNKMSFGDVYNSIQELKEKGLVSASSVNSSISNAIEKSFNKKIH